MNEQIINPIDNVHETGEQLVQRLFDAYNNTMIEYIKENAEKIRRGSMDIFNLGFDDFKNQQKARFTRDIVTLYKDALEKNDLGVKEYINDIMKIKGDNASLVASQAVILLIENKYSGQFQDLIKEIANSSVEDDLKKRVA